MLRRFALFFALVLLSAATFQPSHAQEAKPNTVSFNGVSFSFESTIANSVQISTYPGDPKNTEKPGGAEPKHLTFSLYKQVIDSDPNAGSPVFENFIQVYKVDDLKGYAEYEKRFGEIDKLAATTPDLAPYTAPMQGDKNLELPFLPVYPASQVFRGQVKYLKTDQLSGYSFIGAYRQDVSPFTSREFSYLFVGVTADKKTVVSVNLRLDTKLFPKDIPSNFNYDNFVKTLDKYMQDSTATINKAKATDFTPTLTSLEILVKSISIK